MKEHGTIVRTLQRHASKGRKPPPWGYVESGRLHVGTASLHRTRSGVKLNGLMRIWLVTHRGTDHG